PGPVNCMVGTSSDVIFADAYLKGIKFNYEEAFDAILKSASAYSGNMTAGGRKENNTAPFNGYIANNKLVGTASEFVGEAYSSSIEGYINDYGLYRMAEAMGKSDEAEYYYNRCMQYVKLYNAAAGFFMGKSLSGVWSCGQNAFDPAQWNGPMYDFTESVGWMYAFPAVFDGQGLATLHGGAAKLAEKLNALFDDSYEAMKNVVEIGSVHHEIAEFKEVKMGQYMHSNQPSHHVIYTYAFSSEPYRVQQYTREVLRHVYVGSQLGQGYPGDEDNGEMSGWYIFNALGFYPYAMGSNEYVIGSPLFDKVTIHLENGKDIVITANNNSDENVYIQSAKLNGKDYNKMFLTHEQLTSGCEIVFEMGNKPSAWGSAADSAPTSLTAKGEKPTALSDIIKTSGVTVQTDIENSTNLFDNNSLTVSKITRGDTITLKSNEATVVTMVTLASGKAASAPKAFMLEVSNDGTKWTKADERMNVEWKFDNYVQSFSVPEDVRGEYKYYRVTLYGGTELAEIEFIGGKEAKSGVTKADVGLAGYQLGNDGKSLRLVGYVNSLDCEDLEMTVTLKGAGDKTVKNTVSKVHTTMYGTVDGKKVAAVSTDKDANALVSLDCGYLFGTVIDSLQDGTYTMTVTTSAKLNGSTAKGTATLTVTVSGGVITVAK
ncbi:MAG: glycoside hydrolase family 92 protein, partial [Ruminococcaceae bacterium]|nr:glycoside hydrolase family 92 protein [Oscillospiraceae bacterium]